MGWFRVAFSGAAVLAVSVALGSGVAFGQQPAEPPPVPVAAPAPVAPAPAPTPAPAGAAAATPSDAPVLTPTGDTPPADQAAVDFGRELRTVEEDVGNLKERVFRSKATLKLLKELVVDPAISGSRLAIWHVNKLGGGYSMESAQYFIDGKSVFSKVDPSGTLDSVREIKVSEQTVPAGTHVLQVNLVLRGNGYKVFSYLRSYQFKVTSSYTFKVEEGRVSVIRVLADSRGGLRNFVERPTIHYDERTESYREE
ncbi:MAG: dihydrolipoamide acetyltransferase [Myxococcota bacterium]